MGKPQRGVDLMVQAAEALIIKGKDQGRLSPDDILAGLSGTQLDPDELIQVSEVFQQMGIPIADGDKDLRVTSWTTTCLPRPRRWTRRRSTIRSGCT